MADDLTVAVSYLQNYGQHHAWCTQKLTGRTTCECGYIQAISDLQVRLQAAEMVAAAEPVIAEAIEAAASTREPTKGTK